MRINEIKPVRTRKNKVTTDSHHRLSVAANGLATALKEIYRAPSADAAEKALTAFEAGPWGQRYPAIGQSWRRVWAEVIPFFAFPDEVRRIVYTTDVIDKTFGFQMCYDPNARATSRRRAERRLQVPSGRLFTALPT